MTPHLSQDELLDQIYGLGAHDAHLHGCAECSGRLRGMSETKARLRVDAASQSAVSSEFLAAQRRAIYSRMDQAAKSYVRWAPALAGAGLLAMGLFLIPHAGFETRVPVPVTQVEVNADQQLLSDLYSMEQSVEPSAAAPIHELFDPPAEQ